MIQYWAPTGTPVRVWTRRLRNCISSRCSISIAGVVEHVSFSSLFSPGFMVYGWGVLYVVVSQVICPFVLVHSELLLGFPCSKANGVPDPSIWSCGESARSMSSPLLLSYLTIMAMEVISIPSLVFFSWTNMVSRQKNSCFFVYSEFLRDASLCQYKLYK